MRQKICKSMLLRLHRDSSQSVRKRIQMKTSLNCEHRACQVCSLSRDAKPGSAIHTPTPATSCHRCALPQRPRSCIGWELLRKSRSPAANRNADSSEASFQYFRHLFYFYFFYLDVLVNVIVYTGPVTRVASDGCPRRPSPRSGQRSCRFFPDAPLPERWWRRHICLLLRRLPPKTASPGLVPALLPAPLRSLSQCSQPWC